MSLRSDESTIPTAPTVLVYSLSGRSGRLNSLGTATAPNNFDADRFTASRRTHLGLTPLRKHRTVDALDREVVVCGAEVDM